MKFMTFDFLVPFVCVVTLASSSTLFYIDMTRKVGVSNQEKIGTITFKKRIAQRKYMRQVVWEEVSNNSIVYNNDSIRTGSLSDATVTLKDGTEIVLSENSLILLTLSKDQFDIEFKKGSVVAKREGTGDNKINIKTKDAVISLTSASLTLTKGKGKDLNITVNKGKADIKIGDISKTIGENQKAVFSKDSLDIKELKIKLIAPSPSKYFMISKKTKRVDFSWNPLKGKNLKYLQVARSFDFKKIILNRRSAKNFNFAVLKKGIYYWRLKVIDRKTRKAAYSEMRRMSIINNDPVYLIYPRNKALITFRSKLPPINFRWSESRQASSYEVLISNDQSFNTTVKKINMTGKSISIKELQKGKYFWKVNVITKLSGEIFKTSSNTGSFIISQNKNLEPPTLVTPLANKKINRLVLKKRSVTFTWRKNPEINKFKLQISKSSDFSDITYQTVTSTNFHQFKKELPIGLYYWRVAGMFQSTPESKAVPINSQGRIFSITKADKIKLFKPIDRFVVVSERFKKPSLNFQWDRTGLKGKYKLLVSNNKGFSSIYRSSIISGLTRSIGNLEPGKYFWRVEFYDENENLLVKSNARSILVLAALGKPVLMEPDNGQKLDMSDKDSIELKWRKLPGVDTYKVGLYSSGSGAAVFEINTRENEYNFDDLKKLDEGNFYWTVQALDNGVMSRNYANRVYRKSPVVKSSFNITLGNYSEDVKKIKAPKILFTE